MSRGGKMSKDDLSWLTENTKFAPDSIKEWHKVKETLVGICYQQQLS